MASKEKVALVTGGATGIGRAIAVRLGRDGVLVAVNHLPGDEANAAAAVAAVEAAGGVGLAVAADVSRVRDVRAMFDAVFARWGRLDILVNNAATTFNKPVAEVTEEEFDLIFAVNVKGTFFACQEAARRMADGGRVINLSSSTTGLMLPGYGAYDATKGAVEQLTRVLSKELGPRGITVNAVSPGATATELFRRGKSEELIRSFERMASLGRLGEVEDIAEVVGFLASDAGRWVTGQNLRTNGGTV